MGRVGGTAGGGGRSAIERFTLRLHRGAPLFGLLFLFDYMYARVAAELAASESIVFLSMQETTQPRLCICFFGKNSPNHITVGVAQV